MRSDLITTAAIVAASASAALAYEGPVSFAAVGTDLGIAPVASVVGGLGDPGPQVAFGAPQRDVADSGSNFSGVSGGPYLPIEGDGVLVPPMIVGLTGRPVAAPQDGAWSFARPGIQGEWIRFVAIPAPGASVTLAIFGLAGLARRRR